MEPLLVGYIFFLAKFEEVACHLQERECKVTL